MSFVALLGWIMLVIFLLAVGAPVFGLILMVLGLAIIMLIAAPILNNWTESWERRQMEHEAKLDAIENFRYGRYPTRDPRDRYESNPHVDSRPRAPRVEPRDRPSTPRRATPSTPNDLERQRLRSIERGLRAQGRRVGLIDLETGDVYEPRGD